jgi:hypothetical protein
LHFTQMCIVTRSVQSDSASLQRQTLEPSFMRPLRTLLAFALSRLTLAAPHIIAKTMPLTVPIFHQGSVIALPLLRGAILR